MNPAEKSKFISNWIKDYVNNMPIKAKSLVIGISGGIDSSVSSTLSAMTGLKTIVLSMPIKQKSYQHDLRLLNNLNFTMSYDAALSAFLEYELFFFISSEIKKASSKA